uniref:CUB domain-containing protein n=1 Tax=Magallana gigas TaxID=29159 RepID=A0A8W8NSN7_MAGGI
IRKIAELMMKFYCLIILAVCLNLADGIVREYYMDGPSTCGQTIIIYNDIINLAARSPISTPNPRRVCTTYLRSGYTDSYYYIKVEWTATIKDCAFSLTIYEGSTPSGAPIKSFRCLGDQENSGVVEVRNSTITVQRDQGSDFVQPHNTFNLSISTFRNQSAATEVSGGTSKGTSKLPTGVIMGFVIGLFAMTVFCR